MKRLVCKLFGHNWGRPLMYQIHPDGTCGSKLCLHMAQDCKRCGYGRMVP